MFQSWRPPRGGWKIARLPARFENRDLRFAWENRKPRRNDNHNSAADEMVSFLAKNGHQTTSALKKEIREHADSLWREKEPHRFPKPKNTVRNLNPLLKINRRMSWAEGYWDIGNVLVTGTNGHPGLQLRAFADTGLALLDTEIGCEHCFRHWQRVLDLYPPEVKVTDWKKARVWLWRAHNITRENQEPTAFNSIAAVWNWPRLTGPEINGILAEMGMSETQ